MYIDQLERVQNKFLRICRYKMGFNRTNCDYNYILCQLNMKTLENRESECELRFLHKILNGFVDCPELLELIVFNVNSRRTRSSDLFRIKFHHTNYGKNETITRMMKTANHLQDSVDLFNPSVSAFNNTLKKLRH
uniref:Uncharacterized protein LOC114327862 n=1 Tax=Diabrotica virgifera virgifera TaxID=50390 RepID=A0A6P7FC29_DIAVI